MNNLKKLVLACAITATPFATQALETIDDETLSNVTGQEGITIDQYTRQAIEEFTYVDGDGDGSGSAGKVSLKYISIGNIIDSNFVSNPLTEAHLNATVQLMNSNDMTIDATANGVLINHGKIGGVGSHVSNETGSLYIPPRTTTAENIGGVDHYFMGTSVIEDCFGLPANCGNYVVDEDLRDHGVTTDAATLKAPGNGMDVRVSMIEIGKEDGSGMGNIGSFHMLNASNWMSSAAIWVMVDDFGIAGGDVTAGPGSQATELFNNNGNQWVPIQSQISSKTNGTGVHIQTEYGGVGGQAVFYTDTDGTGGNQIGVLGMGTFRIATSDELGDNQDIYSGTHIRPGYTEFDLDVEDGKLVMSNMIQSNSTMLHQVFIGSVVNATDVYNPTGIIGGFAILGNRVEGSVSIYAH